MPPLPARHADGGQVAGLESRLIRAFRRHLPRRLQGVLPSATKDLLVDLWRFAAARPGPRLAARCALAWACSGLGRRDAAARRWAALAHDWPAPGPPALVATAARHAALSAAPDPAARRAVLAAVLAELDGPHRLKGDRRLLAALAAHLSGLMPPVDAGGACAAPGAGLRRVALVVDILKAEGGYTHARSVLAICRNLIVADPALHIDLVVANERLAAGRMALDGPGAEGRWLAEAAEQAMAGADAARLALHVLRGRGLEGLEAAARTILGLAPDVALFGGGHRGPVSNEARVLRHALHPHLPVAFFFFQASDQVDPAIDLIIARGPHRIAGRPGRVPVRVQPYPTLTPATIGAGPGRRAAPEGPALIVTALAGPRLEARLDELGQRAMRRFLTLLDLCPGAIWHFVGADDPERLLAGNRALRARVAAGQAVVLPVLPAADFAAMVGRARLFVHLPGFTGGSGGAGLARRAGVPILCFQDSDLAGRQPPETVFAEGDAAGFLSAARRVLAEPAFADSLAARQHAHSLRLLNEAPAGFLDALAEAARLGRARLAQARR